jgi:hypothetical protein
MENFYKNILIFFSIVAITVLVFISDWLQNIGLIAFPSGFRHFTILLVFLFVWSLFGRPLAISKYYKISILLMSFYLLVAFLFVKVGKLNYILGIGFTFLFVILFVVASNIRTNINIVVNILKGLVLFLFIMSILPVIEGITLGIAREAHGIFREGGAFGAAMNIGSILGLTLYIITKKEKYFLISIFLTLGVLLSTIKKEIVNNFIIWLSFIIFQKSYKMAFKIVLFLVPCLILGMLITGPQLIENIRSNTRYLESAGSEGHVRVAMYIASLKIASDYFPFGSGMGTFGSLASIVNGYSKTYYDYRVAKIGSNSPKDLAKGHFTLLDTYWPHILGELGFIGGVFFLLIWLFPLASSIKIMRSGQHPDIINGLCFYVIMTIIIMTIDGFALYTPESPAFIILHSGIVGLCYYHISKSKKNAPLLPSIITFQGLRKME